MLKWIKRVFLGFLALTGLALLSGLAYEQWSRWTVARDYKPPGRLIAVDGTKMHLHCVGTGTPTVILESGQDYFGSLSWVLVQPEIAITNRVCSYDRAGILWSESAGEVPNANRIAERLRALLDAASESPPFVMVGHSMGGALVRVFAHRYPQDIAGLVLVDSSHPDQMQRFPPEVIEARQGPSPFFIKSLAAFGVLRIMASGPDDDIPAEAHVSLNYMPQSVAGYQDEFAAFEQILIEAGDTASFGELPLIVLTAGKRPAKIAKIWSELQVELLALSTNGEQRVIVDAGHHIQIDNPTAVVRAIRDVLAVVQKSGSGDEQ